MKKRAKGKFLGTHPCAACGKKVRVYDWLPESVQCAGCFRRTLAEEQRMQDAGGSERRFTPARESRETTRASRGTGAASAKRL
jgi:ribosomal protein S27E